MRKTTDGSFYRDITVSNEKLDEKVSFDTYKNYSAWAKAKGLPVSKLYDTCRKDKSKYPVDIDGWKMKTYGKDFS